ncbi:MAG: sulfatase-like hydrolase/transferase [Flavobacteriaceae bacterium]|nr:sulfatase-like hydrolase/transferase [Eudoraea sp.]NNJ38934.1 sulfatase-like hydrolase/transferase [Flavobacteriaceae bacterium]
MEVLGQISQKAKRHTLKEYIRLAISFFLTLALLSLYQYIRLYAEGVLDAVFSRSLLLSFLHHAGYASLVALLLAFVFNYLENRSMGRGFRVVRFIFWLLLVTEGILMEYYLQYYEILGTGFWNRYFALTTFGKFILLFGGYAIACAIWLHVFYRLTSSVYRMISRMYPFTLILLSLFLATLTTNKKPVNENKTQHLVLAAADEVFTFNTYEGNVEFPLMRPFSSNDQLGDYLNLEDQKPNLVFIVVDGLGSEFVGDDGMYQDFTPFLNSLAHSSLYWPNNLSNTGENYAALPTILGSLPFGEYGFTNLEAPINRQTLFGILKKNGYQTAFYYGGNSALNQLDRFLFEERVDLVVDQKSFGDDYKRQKKDRAGISLGYPDKELYRNWASGNIPTAQPKLEVFLTLSSQSPFLIPDAQAYKAKVDGILKKSTLPSHIRKRIKRNKELFASILYSDDALKSLIRKYSTLPEYQNTLFVITGSHSATELPGADPLERYQVPLFIYSPMVKKPLRIKKLVSHADITPSLVQLLYENYNIQIPERVAWMGDDLVGKRVFDPDKRIPLYRYGKGIKDYISGRHFISDNKLFKLEAGLAAVELRNASLKDSIKVKLNEFRAINQYVTTKDKLLPERYSLFTNVLKAPTKEEQVWINSVFNGPDYDDAYDTARRLALDGDKERALLLCRFILNKVPGHVDTEILMGRIYGWEGKYEMASELLERTVQKYPIYVDAYLALLDIYHWSGQNNKVLLLERKLKFHGINSNEVKVKLKRAKDLLKQDEDKASLAQETKESAPVMIGKGI